LHITPSAAKPRQQAVLTFRILDPVTGKLVTHFETVHEKLFHLFIVSRDLQHFAHEHPQLQPDGSFVYKYRIPQGGQYRLLCDFYPTGGTPQLIARTFLVPGDDKPADLKPD